MDSETYPPSELIQSPYLNVSVLPESKYIYMTGEPAVRGRLEHCFTEIGLMFLIGGAIGSVRGYIKGRKLTRGYPPKLHRTMIFNQMLKSSSLGNTIGVIALLYSGAGIIIEKLREKDDQLNTIGASTMTGILYQASGPVNKTLISALTGFIFGTILGLLSEKPLIAKNTIS